MIYFARAKANTNSAVLNKQSLNRVYMRTSMAPCSTCVATDKTCSKCGAEMRIGLREDLSDKSLFRCPNKQCKATVSRRVDSFLSFLFHVLHMFLTPKKMGVVYFTYE